jgi:hypothetical protein
MLQEILAKLNQHEKLIGIGGVLLASVTISYSYLGYSSSTSQNAFTELAGGTGIGWLAIIAAVAAVVVLYLVHAPNMKITWPAPVSVIELGIAAVAAVVSLLILVFTVQNMDLGLTSSEKDLLKSAGVSIPSWPIFGWVAVAAMVVGAALMCWGAYQEWTLNKTAA